MDEMKTLLFWYGRSRIAFALNRWRRITLGARSRRCSHLCFEQLEEMEKMFLDCGGNSITFALKTWRGKKHCMWQKWRYFCCQQKEEILFSECWGNKWLLLWPGGDDRGYTALGIYWKELRHICCFNSLDDNTKQRPPVNGWSSNHLCNINLDSIMKLVYRILDVPCGGVKSLRDHFKSLG